MRSSTGPVVVSKGRLEAFSDGVFAVAITLLVLDIKVPEIEPDASLWHALGDNWAHYIAYAISFLTIGVMWVNHHNMLGTISGTDRGLLYSNLGLLAVVSFIPFPTSVVSEYFRHSSAENVRAAVGLYGLTMIALGVAFSLIWLHIYHHPQILAAGISPAVLRRDVIRSCGGTGCYVAATALSFAAPTAALFVFAALVVMFALARPIRTQADHPSETDGETPTIR